MVTRDSVSIVFQVRTQSERCKNKILREFYNGKSLIEIAAEKFSHRNDVFIAAHEPMFADIAQQYGIGFIERDLRSALGETAKDVLSYVKDIPTPYACTVNVCSPFMRAETVDAAVAEFRKSTCETMIPAIETHDIFFFDDLLPVNRDAHIFNSKFRKPLYQIANGFVIYTKTNILEKHTYFTEYKVRDPLLFPITLKETLDIDTEEQFQILQSFYARDMRS